MENEMDFSALADMGSGDLFLMIFMIVYMAGSFGLAWYITKGLMYGQQVNKTS